VRNAGGQVIVRTGIILYQQKIRRLCRDEAQTSSEGERGKESREPSIDTPIVLQILHFPPRNSGSVWFAVIQPQFQLHEWSSNSACDYKPIVEHWITDDIRCRPEVEQSGVLPNFMGSV
jgi:hypothetical protein